MNWENELMCEYKEGRRELRYKGNHANPQDKTHINSMISDMTHSIEWMKTGREPGAHRGAGIRGIYQFEDMDVLPDIYEYLKEEREQLFLERDQRQVLLRIFRLFSDRERQCYFMYEAEVMSMSEIGLKLGISKWTVRTHIDRARTKVKNVMSHGHRGVKAKNCFHTSQCDKH